MPGSGLLSKTLPKGEGALTLVPDLAVPLGASTASRGPGGKQGGAQRPGLSPAHTCCRRCRVSGRPLQLDPRKEALTPRHPPAASLSCLHP